MSQPNTFGEGHVPETLSELETFKLAAINENDFSDNEVLGLFKNLTIDSEVQIIEAYSIISKHRPQLTKQLQ